MEEILKGKKILITSGPVWVPIDRVRIITSVFGGTLGTVIAEKAKDNPLKGKKIERKLSPSNTLQLQAPGSISKNLCSLACLGFRFSLE